MRHAIDFLDCMVRDVLDFDIQRWAQLTTNELSLKLFPAAPARAMNEIMHRITSVFMYKYPSMQSIVHTPAENRVTIDAGLLKLHIELCYTQAHVRGSTCAGAMIDTHRFLNAETQRALHNSMVSVRYVGFIAHTVIMPLDF